MEYEKITGKLAGKELNSIIGNGKKILGVDGVLDYQIKISKMDVDDLYRHGMEQYGIKPSASALGKKYRKSFETRCIAAFRKATNQRADVNIERNIGKRKASKLQSILDKAK